MLRACGSTILRPLRILGPGATTHSRTLFGGFVDGCICINISRQLRLLRLTPSVLHTYILRHRPCRLKVRSERKIGIPTIAIQLAETAFFFLFRRHLCCDATRAFDLACAATRCRLHLRLRGVLHHRFRSTSGGLFDSPPPCLRPARWRTSEVSIASCLLFANIDLKTSLSSRGRSPPMPKLSRTFSTSLRGTKRAAMLCNQVGSNETPPTGAPIMARKY